VNSNKHRTAFVTGGRRGIGAAVVTELQRGGVAVLAPTRDELDLANPDSIETYIDECHRKNAHIDIVVNNAGVNILNPYAEVSRDTWATMMQVNLNAPFRLAQAFAPLMQRAGWGRIVNISSMFGVVTRAHRAAYSTTKSALAGLSRTLAVEVGRDNVLVNCVAPGYVETELTRQNNSPEQLDQIKHTIPLGRLAQPAEIAKLVAFLCSDENTYITGQVLLIDGGFTVT
jgi:3-oxoacyl-[acyl-carrier protein] reductase